MVVAIPTPSPPAIYISPPMFNLARSPKVEVPIPIEPAPPGVVPMVLKERREKEDVAVVEVAKVNEVEALFAIEEEAMFEKFMIEELIVRLSVEAFPIETSELNPAPLTKVDEA